MDTVRHLLTLNIPIYFEKENQNTASMESELLLSILTSMAEGESVSISENSKWSVQKRFENGTYKISYPPYGYDENLIVNPLQAAIVKEIFSAHLEDTGKCSMLYVRDNAIKVAFVTMMNKLIFAHKQILKPYAESLLCLKMRFEFHRKD